MTGHTESVKIQPRFILSSFCTLIVTSSMVAAQSPAPRFGYGSVPRGALVIPAPQTVKAPQSTGRPKSVGVASTSKVKPKQEVTSAKSKVIVSAKPTSKSSSKADVGRSGPANEIAGAKKPVSLKSVAGGISNLDTRKSAVVSAKQSRNTKAAASKSTQTAKVAPPSNAKKTGAASYSYAASARNNVPAATGPGDQTTRFTPLVPAGFHFFGSPVNIPGISARPSTGMLAAAREKENFVDIMAARQSLGVRKEAFTPQRPGTKPTTVTSRPSSQAYVPGTGPEIVPQILIPASLKPARLVVEKAAPAADFLDESPTAETVPASLSLSKSDSAGESISDSIPLEEPALPSPVISAVEKPQPSPAKVSPVRAAGPGLPINEAPIQASMLQEAVASAAEKHDLSDREREFVRSLAQAAGSVTSASGKLNQDLPASITTAATGMLDQLPAETISTFRTVAADAKAKLRDVVPDISMEPANDLMPATPEKMPDQLPAFQASPNGKIDVQSDRQADYDQANNKVIFTGKVELNSSAIRLRAERVEVFMKKGGGGMERVEAKGNVLMRTQETENGPGQMASAGRASYNLKTGEITLSDWPKIQEAGKSHISTDPSTKMYMFTDGRLRTDGPNRTLIGGG